MAAGKAAAGSTGSRTTRSATTTAPDTTTTDEAPEQTTPTQRGRTSAARKGNGAKSAGGGRKNGNGTATPSGDGRRRLVIVESPAKARKIADYLGSSYIVESSRGHIRDLPRGAADVPAKYKGESWARLGVDVDHEFEPLYIVTPDKKSTVSDLKDALKEVDELYLATDGDREGEAIAWHLLETLKPKV
ncbi:MAG: topoisomerase, partial [Actinomycetota bacterium]|nr:topoisomerase [Actinomycetota bacterium]